MTWLPLESPRPRAAALAAATAIALAAGIALIATSTGGRAHPRPRSPATHATPRTPTVFPHTPAGAVSAATALMQGVMQSPYDGTWATTTSSLSTPALEARMRTGNPGAALLYRRLTAPQAPAFAVRAYPLGYAVRQYSPTSARVRVWLLYVLELARPVSVVGYTSADIWLQWTEGSWKAAGVRHGPDLTPPGVSATATQITAWIDAVDQLHRYSYAP